ncbi:MULTISPECIES: HypC/HybG/HupF family hydrogenase formation chaperone [Atlantibacter]|uniref:HypC/HybG/HupF family hydrogenase formation chaperone n=1 Tax=Atlantibacter TaxID=1903434 RepID=UPI0022B7C084|nr:MULTISPECIES: HypC/HybG/HupF family hydrogenase formation chaperone [Atlantibacter]MCZ7835012.1 HypC/HybG/HupF family hydrogenase formation chaperone [Atlantibacter hermannii]
MCIGIPGQICEIGPGTRAQIEVSGARRDIDLSLVGTHDEHGNSRVGQWVLVHVGFAMSVIDEHEARETLEALHNMYDVEPDVGVLLFPEEHR